MQQQCVATCWVAAAQALHTATAVAHCKTKMCILSGLPAAGHHHHTTTNHQTATSTSQAAQRLPARLAQAGAACLAGCTHPASTVPCRNARCECKPWHTHAVLACAVRIAVLLLLLGAQLPALSASSRSLTRALRMRLMAALFSSFSSSYSCRRADGHSNDSTNLRPSPMALAEQLPVAAACLELLLGDLTFALVVHLPYRVSPPGKATTKVGRPAIAAAAALARAPGRLCIRQVQQHPAGSTCGLGQTATTCIKILW